MTRSLKRSLCGVMAFGASALLASAQEPVSMPFTGQVVQTPKKDEKKVEPKKEAPKKEEPKPEAPPKLPDLSSAPPVTLSTGPQAPSLAVPAAMAAVALSVLPPVYGDQLFPQVYSPYLRAETPQGMISQVRPGQTSLFPVGTVFDRPVNSQIVKVKVGERVIPPGGAGGNDFPITVPVFEDRVQVTGTPATANFGGIPVNVARGAFKVAENESVRPIDRFYVSYNYFYDVNPTLSVPELPITSVHRETFGLEKTFLDGDASVGIRVPYLQVSGASNVSSQALGDVSVILKYAFYNENPPLSSQEVVGPGNVLAGGLVITAPTGNTSSYAADVPVIHSTILQPWLGAIYVRGNLFFQGFSSIAVPTDESDTTYIFNSLQIGYLLYKAPDTSRFLTSVTPIVECHVNTPLNNRGLTRTPIGAIDVVNFTGGVTLGLGSRSFLNLGSNTPTSGPQPYVTEAIAQLNIRY